MPDMQTIVSLCKRRGFIFQSSEIYGGTGSCWDYGPLGTELKNNIKQLWWRDNVQLRDDMIGIDSSILMHPRVWQASGHVEHFNDPLVDCKECKQRFRVDWEILSFDSICKKCNTKIKKDDTCSIKCPECASIVAHCPSCSGELTDARRFNLMFKTFMGPVEDEASITYLRPETAQGIFVNFLNVLNCSRKKLPFGIAQIGKSFRNEITPGNFIFRTREFEQMEIEYFVKPAEDEKTFDEWVQNHFEWYIKSGIKPENLRKRAHTKDELAHYAKACIDIEYNFPMGWSELEGIANRTDYDLKKHSEYSGEKLTYYDEDTTQHITPFVIEPSAGVDRSLLAFLVDAYHEEKVRGETRVVLKLHHELAPLKIAVLPLLKKRSDIVELAQKVTFALKKIRPTMYDDTASIGRLYRRQDEAGTPYCVTVDVETIEKDSKVTIRERDSMQQIRVPVDKITDVFSDIFPKGWKTVATSCGIWATG